MRKILFSSRHKRIYGPHFACFTSRPDLLSPETEKARPIVLLNVIERNPDTLPASDTPLPTIVLIHGLFGQARNLGFAQRHLAATHRTLAIDLRNHGKSPHGPMTYQIMAEDVRETIRHFTTEPVILLGHSMGGKTAMTLALTHPEMVHSLIVGDIAPGAGGFANMDLSSGLEHVNFPARLDRKEADTLLRPLIPNDSVRQLMMQNLTLGETPGWSIGLHDIFQSLPAVMGWPDFPPDTHYEGPALFIKGELSPYIQPHNFPVMRQLFPHYTLETIEKAGHWIHADAPARFIELVDAFIKAH